MISKNSLPQGAINGYARVHYLARKNKARICDSCQGGGLLDMARCHNAPIEHLLVDPENNCVFSLEPSDYRTLCRACHKKLDAVDNRPFCKHGHTYDVGNTSYKSGGSRRCLACHRAAEEKRLAQPGRRDAKNAAGRKRPPPQGAALARKLELQRIRRAAAKKSGATN